MICGVVNKISLSLMYHSYSTMLESGRESSVSNRQDTVSELNGFVGSILMFVIVMSMLSTAVSC